MFKKKLLIHPVIFIACLGSSWQLSATVFDLSEQLLHYSVNGHTGGVVQAMKEGADVDSRDKELYYEGETPLMKTALNGDIKISEMLLNHGAEINVVDERGETAILVAAYVGNYEMVKFLYERGADINIASSSGYTPLLVAADRGYRDIVDYLLERGAKIRSAKSGYNIVMAVSKYHPELIDFFIQRGVDPNARTNKGQTALMEAACAGNIESVKMLINNKLSLCASDAYGRDILYYILHCYNNNAEAMIEYLVQSDPEFISKIKISAENSLQILHKYLDGYFKNMDLFERLVRANPAEFALLDELYLRQLAEGPKRNAQGSEDGNTKIDAMISIVKRYGSESPHYEIIQRFKELNRKIDVGRYSVGKEIQQEFSKIVGDLKQEQIIMILESVSPAVKKVYFQLLTGSGIFLESYYNNFDYIDFLCIDGKEEVLTDYYEKNYPRNWSNLNGVFQRAVLKSCSANFMRKMIENKDEYLDANGIGYFDFHFQTDYNKKLNMFVENINTNIEPQLADLIVRSLRNLDAERDTMPDVNFTDTDSNTFLHLVLQEHDQQKRYTPLSLTDYSIICAQLKKNINVNAVNREGKTPLHYAALNGYPSVVRLLVEHGADPDRKDVYGQNALFLSALNDHTSITRYLLDKTENTESLAMIGEMDSRTFDDRILKKYSISLSPEIKIYFEKSEYSDGVPLPESPIPFSVNDCRVYRAVERKDIVRVNSLLDSGYSPDCVQVFDSNGWTPLQEAIFNKDVSMVRTLIEHGASVKERSGSGHPLLPDYVKNPEIKKLIMDKRASEGRSP